MTLLTDTFTLGGALSEKDLNAASDALIAREAAKNQARASAASGQSWTSRTPAELQQLVASRDSARSSAGASSTTAGAAGQRSSLQVADARGAGAAGQGSGSCEDRVAWHERKVQDVTRSLPPRDQIKAFEAVMWATQSRIKLLNDHCPTSAQTRKLVKELQDAYDQAELACNSVSTVRCSPMIVS